MAFFKEFLNSKNEIIYYTGNPNFSMLESLSTGTGDLWHSSFEQGYKNAFPEIVYFSAAFFWYVNDFDNLEQCVSWRVNPEAFAIRKSVWDSLNGFDKQINNKSLQAIDFGYNLLKNSAGIPLYVKNLYTDTNNTLLKINSLDRHIFYRKNFKTEHAVYMNFRIGFWKLNEWRNLFKARKYEFRKKYPVVKPRTLNKIKENPSVSYIIPTMLRQDFTLILLNDLKNQTYLPNQVVVVDATPEEKRDVSLYNPDNYPFEVIFKWQTTKGSCRARNEAIELCTGDYIVFGDDDVRIPADFIENHIKFLQTYNAIACNGLDIRADHQQQNLKDLEVKLNKIAYDRYKAGVALCFSNANSCVKREYVNKLEGNDINFDGGYGEDSDFGLSLVKLGIPVLYNPFSANLHLKPPTGGYRFWGNQSKLKGKKRKTQPWELDEPVKNIVPVPSPTVMYFIHKHFNTEVTKEYAIKYFVLYLTRGKIAELPFKLINLPYKILQYKKSVFYAKKLIALGKRTK